MIADDRELEGADHGVECSYTEVYNELVYDAQPWNDDPRGSALMRP